MTTHHTPTGARHEGDEFDCGFCREALLEAFRAPADTAPPGPPVAPPQRRHLTVPPDRTQTVPFPDHSTWEGARRAQPGWTWEAGCPCGWNRSGGSGRLTRDEALRQARTWAAWHRAHPESTLGEAPTAHEVSWAAHPFPDQLGGVWIAACVCGWTKNGSYAQDGFEQAAQRLAEECAARHLRNPEADL
jgi:hypothetical protein